MNNNNKETSHDVTWCRKPCQDRETQENTHINTQYNHKKVANNVSNEIKQKRVVTSDNNGEMPMDNKDNCGAQQG